MFSWLGFGGISENPRSDISSPPKKEMEVALEEGHRIASQQQQLQHETRLTPQPPQQQLEHSLAASHISHAWTSPTPPPQQQQPQRPPTINPIPSDTRQVIDTLRKDLGSQRKTLENFYEKLEPMILQFKTMAEHFETLKSEASLSQLKNHFVGSVRFAEAIADVKLELNSCKVALSTANVANPAMRPEIVEQTVAQAVAAAMQSAVHMAHEGRGNQWRDEFNERMIELRHEIARGYVRRDEFTTSLNEVKEQSSRDVSLLQDALEASARKIGCLGRPDFPPGVEPPTSTMEYTMDKFSNPTQSVARMIATPPSQVSPSRSRSIQRNSYGGAREEQVVITLNRKDGSKLGLSLDGSDGKTLAIERIALEGDIPSWNAANPSSALKVGDHIVSINDVTGDSGRLIDEMSSSSNSKTVLHVVRAPESRKVVHIDDVDPTAKKQILIKLPADRDGKLGMSLKCDENDVLKIAKIAVGCVQRWNERNPSMAVRPGDQLIAANGKSGSPSAMLEELKDCGEVNLVFVRND